MDENEGKQDERELTIDEVIGDAMRYLDYPGEVMSPDEPDGFHCDMTPEEHELARAAIAYVGYRLLLEFRMKRSKAYRSGGGGVAMSHFSHEIRQEIADALGISGTTSSREDEVKRLYRLAMDTREQDEEFRGQVDGLMEGLEEDYDLDAGSLGILFI